MRPVREGGPPVLPARHTAHMHTHDDRVDYDQVSPGRYQAACTCGQWQHSRHVDINSERDRIEVEAAWTEHHLTSLSA